MKSASTTAARQRQTAFELERHSFEANTLTQMFLILSKRRASWWRDADGTSEKAVPSSNSAAEPQEASGGDPLASSVRSPTPTRHRSKTLDASNLSNASIPSVIPSIKEITAKERLKLKREQLTKSAGKPAKLRRQLEDEDDDRALQIPDTVVWENNIPKGWFYFDQKEAQVARRKVETKQIQEAFLKDALFENDIVAVVYSVPNPNHQPSHNSTDGSMCGGHGGSGVGGTASGGNASGSASSSTKSPSERLMYRYLTAAELPMFLFENRRGKGTSILQKFTYPLNIQHNDCIQIVWSPTVTQVHRRQNVHDIFDERVAPNERCATFEGRTHLSRDVQCTPKLKDRVVSVVREFVKHFQETDSKHSIQRLVMFAKITDSSDILLLYASSVRVMSATVASPIALLPGGPTITVHDPAHGSSHLHKKYRVTLELATTYELKDIGSDDAGRTASPARSPNRSRSVAGGDGGNLRQLKSMESPAMSATSHDGRVHVTVGARTGAHHGFLMRLGEENHRSVARPASALDHSGSMTPCGSPKRGATTPHTSPTPRARGRLNSLRSSNVDRLSLIAIVQDAVKVQEREVTDSQASKVRALLQAAMKRAGQPALRAALLQTRPNDELTEFEKMELLALKLREVDRRRLRRSSTKAAGGLVGGTGPDPHFVDLSREGSPQVASAVSSVFFTADSTDSTAAHHTAPPSKQTVFDGVVSGVDAATEARWSELCYAAQLHFDDITALIAAQGPSAANRPFRFLLNGRSSTADAAIASWLAKRKAAADAMERIGHGVLVREGATLRFDLERMSAETHLGCSELPISDTVMFVVPHQMRAAQKIFHEAHEAMCSREFARIIAAMANGGQTNGTDTDTTPPVTEPSPSAVALGQTFDVDPSPSAAALPPTPDLECSTPTPVGHDLLHQRQSPSNDGEVIVSTPAVAAAEVSEGHVEYHDDEFEGESSASEAS